MIDWLRLCLWFWTVLAVVWFILAFRSKPTQRPERRFERLLHVFLVTVGFYLLTYGNVPPFLRGSIWPHLTIVEVIGTVATAIGVAFAIWARLTLGSNWSGAVTLKAGHHLIQTGPYRWVRHPIYTGILLGALGTSVVVDEWRAPVGWVLMVVTFLFKMNKEERLMSEQFPNEYRDYQSKSKRLVPFLY